MNSFDFSVFQLAVTVTVRWTHALTEVNTANLPRGESLPERKADVRVICESIG
jgi:hypothetical protein